MQEWPGAFTKSLPVTTAIQETTESERRQILRHSGYLLAARLLSRIASVPFLIYAAATLGPDLFGIFTFVLAGVETDAAYTASRRFGISALMVIAGRTVWLPRPGCCAARGFRRTSLCYS